MSIQSSASSEAEHRAVVVDDVSVVFERPLHTSTHKHIQDAPHESQNIDAATEEEEVSFRKLLLSFRVSC